VISRISLRDLENKLPSDLFMRVHKSFIISLNRIDSVQKYKLQVSGQEIPIGGLYRNVLNLHINERNIQVKGLD
jgi:DNA-binding LytR/AlgR family response regulator